MTRKIYISRVYNSRDWAYISQHKRYVYHKLAFESIQLIPYRQLTFIGRAATIKAYLIILNDFTNLYGWNQHCLKNFYCLRDVISFSPRLVAPHTGSGKAMCVNVKSLYHDVYRIKI